MKRLTAVLVPGLVFCGALAHGQQRPPLSAKVSNLPLSFEANVGQAGAQTGSDVHFIARSGANVLHFTPDGVALGQGIRIRFEKSATPTGEERLPGRVNYLIGRDPAKWHTNVPTFAKVRYRNVYPGIDIVYYGNNRQLEYDFIVAPGADPTAIRMHLDGATPLRVASNGDLTAGPITLRKPAVFQEANGTRTSISGDFALAAGGAVEFRVGPYDRTKPLVIDPVLVFSTYLGGSATDVANAMAVDASGNVYLAGGTISPDFPVTSGVFQSKLNSAPGFGAAFVSKLNAAGTALIYSTYVGGTGGESAYGLAVDAAGDAYFVGQTASKDFPATAGAFQTAIIGSRDSFVAKLNPTGTALLYATYLGGTTTTYECCDGASAVAVDAAGNAYVTGDTYATGFPVTPGAPQTKLASGLAENAFVTKLNPTGTALVYSTLLGGSGQGSFSIGPAVFDGDFGTAIAVDAAGNAYVTGVAYSTNFPVTAGAFQSTNKAATTQGVVSSIPGFNAFLTKINPAGTAFVFSTYLGGSGVTFPNGPSGTSMVILGDRANALAVDGAGNIYIAGVAYSADFPTTTGAYQTKLQASQPVAAGNFGLIGSNAFVAKMNAAGNALLFSTFLGGSGTDRANAMAIDAAGNVYLAGSTTSTDFPVMAGALQSVNKAAVTNKASSGFLAELNPAGAALLYSTYFGGSGIATANQSLGDAAYSLALDSSANVYIVGSAYSSDFPTTQGALQTNNAAAAKGGTNAFVAKFNLTAASGGAPSVRPNFGVVDGASYKSTLAAGELATLFGYNLGVTTASASGTPLGTSLGGTQVMIGGIAAPLLYVSPSQINLQVPWEVSGPARPSIVVTTPSGATPAAASPTWSAAAPAIFAANSSGVGQGAVIATTGQIAAPGTPATRGQYVMIFCTGLGAVSNQPATGVAATASMLSNTTLTPTVTIGGVLTTTNFSGLAPGFVGLYQVNALVPTTISAGSAVSVSMSVNGVSSNTVTIAVQ